MALAKRIKQLLKFEEAVWIRKMPEGKLQPDHKFPQIRWNTNEEENTVLTDEELRKKFILLTESNNQLKSRNCERCVEKGIRGYFPGIKYWYEGDENWRHAKEDEAGCVGCFWYDPYEWRKKLNELIQNS